jgi:hypothetical protein
MPLVFRRVRAKENDSKTTLDSKRSAEPQTFETKRNSDHKTYEIKPYNTLAPPPTCLLWVVRA